LAERCRLIVTTTSSRRWLLGASEVYPGTHVTAVGADGGGKQEIDPELFAKAAVRAVDSKKQCAQFGDSAYALRGGLIQLQDLVELGELIDRQKARSAEQLSDYGCRPDRRRDTGHPSRKISAGDATSHSLRVQVGNPASNPLIFRLVGEIIRCDLKAIACEDVCSL